MNIPYHLLKDTATFKNPTSSVSTSGNQSLSYGSGTSLKCRIQGENGQEGLQWLRTYGKHLYTVYAPSAAAASLTIEHDCQIAFTDAAGNARTLRVIGPAFNPAGSDVLQVVRAESWEGLT